MAAGYQVVMANAAPDPWPSGGIGSGRPDEAGSPSRGPAFPMLLDSFELTIRRQNDA